MPRVSIVVPVYNNERYLDQCLLSLRSQTYRDLEIIAVDDASSDASAALAERHAEADPRVRVLRLEHNQGTLGARKAGILTSTGAYVTLIDQDDELVPEAIERLVAYAEKHPTDIIHFAVHVEAENEAARDAQEGMTGFLTPRPRRIEGAEILSVQLAEEGGFDWHVHHKFYRGDFARACWAQATDERLVLADDIYLSFILCAQAASYEAVPDSPWYVYHLGRGETYGNKLSLESFERLARSEGDAWRYARAFMESPSAPARTDWYDRLDDLRDRLVFHTMNEWMDSLPQEYQEAGVERAVAHQAPDAVAGELYRFVRDAAYALLMEQRAAAECVQGNAAEPAEGNGPDAAEGNIPGAAASCAADASPAAPAIAASAESPASALTREAKRLWQLAQKAEKTPGFNAENRRYQAMKAIALSHLRDTGLAPAESTAAERQGQKPVPHKQSLAARLWARLRGRADENAPAGKSHDIMPQNR